MERIVYLMIKCGNLKVTRNERRQQRQPIDLPTPEKEEAWRLVTLSVVQYIGNFML